MKDGFLTEKEKSFVRIFRSHLNIHGLASRAAREAGYCTKPRSVNSTACRIMQQPEIMRAIFHGIPDDNSPPCLHCGKIFAVKHPTQRFCSQPCRDNERRAKARVPLKKCAICLSEFRPRGNGMFCSAECRRQGSRRNYKGRYKRKGFTNYSSEHWVSKAKVAIQALEELGIKI